MTFLGHSGILESYAFKDRVKPKCDDIIAVLRQKHPLITWRYFLNHAQYNNESSPIESVDFRATIYLNHSDRNVQQRITVEAIELSAFPLDEMIAHQVRISFARYIMSDEHD
jgi:hypothetical protein